MSFKSYAVIAFKSEQRRIISLVISQLVLWLSMKSMIYYVDEVCAQPVLGFISIFAWICLMVSMVWVSIMAVSPHLILPSVLKDYFYSVWDNENYSDLIELPILDPFDGRLVRINPQSRFRFLFFSFCFLALLVAHFTHHQFFIRYQKSGYVVTYLRNVDHTTKLKGLNLMIDLGKHALLDSDSETLPHSIKQLLLTHLENPHEALRARSAFVVGFFDMFDAVPILQKMAEEDEVLREVALFALGNIKIPPPADNPAHSALKILAKNSTVIQSAPYALSIALGTQKLIQHDLLWKLYQTHVAKDQSQNESEALEYLRIRQASIWALGESRDPVLVKRLGHALQDTQLSIRCLAAYGMEKVVAFESSPYLRKAFEVSSKEEQCQQLETPEQVGGKGVMMLPKRSYQLTLARALATTDDPILLTWMVTHQEGIDTMAHRLLYKYYKALEQKDKDGLLEGLKRRNKSLKK